MPDRDVPQGRTIKREGARPPDPPPPQLPPRRLSWYETAPETPRRDLPWREERRLATAQLAGERNRRHVEDWAGGLGHGAPVHLRADVARAIAEVALDEARHARQNPSSRLDPPLLDDVVDHFLRVALGLPWPLPPEPDGW